MRKWGRERSPTLARKRKKETSPVVIFPRQQEGEIEKKKASCGEKNTTSKSCHLN